MILNHSVDNVSFALISPHSLQPKAPKRYAAVLPLSFRCLPPHHPRTHARTHSSTLCYTCRTHSHLNDHQGKASSPHPIHLPPLPLPFPLPLPLAPPTHPPPHSHSSWFGFSFHPSLARLSSHRSSRYKSDCGYFPFSFHAGHPTTVSAHTVSS